MVLGVLTAFVARSTYYNLIGLLGSNRYVMHAIGQFLTLALGLGLLILFIWAEHSYRTGAQKQQFAARFCWVTAWELTILAVCHGLVAAVELYYGKGTPLALLILLGEGLGAILFWWLYRRALGQPRLPKAYSSSRNNL